MVMSIHEKEEPQKKQWGRYLIGIVCYFIQRGQTLVVLLAGGDKRTQPRDIQKAITLSKTV